MPDTHRSSGLPSVPGVTFAIRASAPSAAFCAASVGGVRGASVTSGADDATGGAYVALGCGAADRIGAAVEASGGGLDAVVTATSGVGRDSPHARATKAMVSARGVSEFIHLLR